MIIITKISPFLTQYMN